MAYIENYDFVSFKNYQKDMDELGTAASVVITRQREKIDEIQMLLLCVIQAAGGTVVVPNSLLRRFDNPTWTIERDEANACVRYTVSI